MSERAIAVIGAGAIGLTLASAVARAGRPVLVCGGSRRLTSIEVTEADQTERWPVRHTIRPDDLDAIDTAVVAVKAHATPAIASWLAALDRPTTSILVAQNGVEQRERIRAHASRARVVPAIVYMNVERTAPGHAILRRVGEHDLAVPAADGETELSALLTAGGLRVRHEPDFLTASWAKLLTNITANPLTALTGRRADVLRDEAVADLAHRLMREAVRVAQAEGAALTDADADYWLRWLHGVPAGATTSMLQDSLAGRPLEYDALTGAVVRAAERHGVPVPLNRVILALVAAMRPEAH